jgi:hypothetical protein
MDKRTKQNVAWALGAAPHAIECAAERVLRAREQQEVDRLGREVLEFGSLVLELARNVTLQEHRLVALEAGKAMKHDA